MGTQSTPAAKPPGAALWKQLPERHDYAAAESYLSMVVEPTKARALVRKLKSASAIERDAKDILRASQLPLLPRSNKHVAADLAKVEQGESLSPILLVRGRSSAAPLIVADGYHRVCASWYLGEDEAVPCKLVSQ